MISKIRHQTCQISDFHTECYKGGSDLQDGVRQAEHFMQLKIRRNYAALLKTIIIRVVFPSSYI